MFFNFYFFFTLSSTHLNEQICSTPNGVFIIRNNVVSFNGKSFKKLFLPMLHEEKKVKQATKKKVLGIKSNFLLRKHITRLKAKRYFLLIKSL